jgi:hypothetical protein
MGNVLENRLRKLEKTARAQEHDMDQGAWRQTAGKLRRTHESRFALRAYCQRISDLCTCKSASALRR